MPAESFKRKLTAILSADVKGYSRLMGDNEAETVRTLTSYRKIMGELIQQHRGRVIDSPGDNMLAEFASVVDAVQCSVAVQNELKARNAGLQENRRMVFRIGVNVGDVIEEEGRIYGDGVNIAARLEALAEPGGICISKTVFDHIESKLPLGYQYLGDQTVKNIAKPVGAYKVLLERGVPSVEEKKNAKKVSLWQRRPVLAGATVVLVIILGVLFWNFYPKGPQFEPISKEKMAFPLPDKPSIAVLPFANMSGDPGQDFLADGITENITTALSCVPEIFVVARNSTFTFKGRAVKVQQVAEELGVRYVLEGSVLRSENRIRVTAQLIDALKGHHLWAERYDRELNDLFALQDDLTMKILNGLALKLIHGEQALHPKAPKGLETYLKMMQGFDYLRNSNIDSNNRARVIGEEIISIEPDYWGGHLLMGSVHMMDYWLGSSENPVQSLNMAIQHVEKSTTLTDRKGNALEVLGFLYSMNKDYDKAIEVGEQAIALIPNGADAHAWLAMSLNYAGRPEVALPLFEKAMRLNPIPPAYYYLNNGHSYSLLRRFEEAVALYKKAVQLTPDSSPAYAALAATYGLMGREKEAKAAAAELLRIDPKFSVEYAAKTNPSMRPADTENFIQGLRKAGLR